MRERKMRHNQNAGPENARQETTTRATISVAFCCHVVLPYCPIHCLLRCVLWANKVMMMMMMKMQVKICRGKHVGKLDTA